MKNFKLQPFEKNNYFYGKLLTVRDFQIEQKYNNEKRWMINRLMFGTGIASGLNTVVIDEQTITVESGVAIDNLGREIVVSSPITQKLSLIDGFDNSGYSKSVYLCIDYEEKGKERIQTITNAVDDNSDDALSYNRIQENYRIYLKENVSSDDANKNNTSSFNKTIIYENKKVQLCQTTPKYLEPNEEFDVIVDIIKKDPTCRVECKYTISSENAVPSDDSTSSLIINFAEPDDASKTNYTLKYRMIADSRIEKNSSMHIMVESIKTNEQVINQINDLFVDFSIVDEKLDALFKNYSNRSIEGIINDESFETIYLAKINMLKVGSTYLIKSIANCPFNQYVYSNNILVDLLQQGLNNDSRKQINENASEGKSVIQEDIQKNSQDTEGIMQVPDLSMSQGEYVFKLDDKAKYPVVLYSKEIIHNLGEGDVMINTSVYEEENFEDILFSGDVDIFDRCQCKIATTLNPKKGTFVIAVKVMNSFRYDQIRVKWYAIKNNRDNN